MSFLILPWIYPLLGCFLVDFGKSENTGTNLLASESTEPNPNPNQLANLGGQKLESNFENFQKKPILDSTTSTTSFFSPPMQSLVPSSYYVPAVLPPPPNYHRSEKYERFPYAFEHQPIEYPIAYYNNENNNAVGPSSKHLVIVSFIGLLLLFAIIQNSLLALKRKDAILEALTNREKRDVSKNGGFHPTTPEQEEILNDIARVRCIQRTVCFENQKLFQNFGRNGKILGRYLTRGVEKSLEKSPGWDRLVEDAGAAGLRGDDCEVLYRDCDVPLIPLESENS